MTTKTELLALAEALEDPEDYHDDEMLQAAAALREYAATMYQVQPEPLTEAEQAQAKFLKTVPPLKPATMDAEPVAWVDPMWLISGGSSEDVFMDTEPHVSCGWVPLFLSPAPRKPLSTSEIQGFLVGAVRLPLGWELFARAIERAHGIGEKT